MREQCDKGDEKLATRVETDGIGRTLVQDSGTVIERLYELEHSTGWKEGSFWNGVGV